MNAQTETPLPQLVKMSDTYKLIVPAKVEEKIRYLIRKYPHTEWSGVLFIKHTGSFEDNNLVITCEDLYPMDLGTTGWTEFKMNEDVTSYMAENIELFECDLSLVHSHHTLGAFISGQDAKTLQVEGNDTNCFVSLIVDTRGTYVAAITRKIQRHREVVTKDLGTSYEFFGEGAIATEENPISEVKQIINDEVIQYFMLDVEVEKVDNPLSYLDDRFEEIEARKKPAVSTTTTRVYDPKKGDTTVIDNRNYGSDYDEDFFSWLHKDKKDVPKEQNLFSEKELAEMEVAPTEDANWAPDLNDIKKAVCRMVTCSLILNTEKFDLKQWIVKHMDNMYKKIFFDNTISGVNSLDQWADFIVEYTLDTFPITEEATGMDIDEVNAAIAMALYNELDQYDESSKYIRIYLDTLERYIYN